MTNLIDLMETTIPDMKNRHDAEIWKAVEAAMAETYQQKDAAERLGVFESWLTRYLRKNKELLRWSGKIPAHRKWRIIHS